MMTTDARPLAAHVDEARRILAAADSAGVTLRITGGVGVALRCPSASAAPLARDYADIDAVGRGGQRREITALFGELGYAGDDAFNALHGESRLFFWDPANERQLDVFLDRVEMCHRIDLRGRLDVDAQTLTLADLLLMKLQVVETNDKDFTDMAALLVDQQFADHDDGAINVDYLCELAGHDWGLWRTMTMVAGRLETHSATLGDDAIGATVHEKVTVLLERLDSAPKSRGWRLRSRVGDRVRWYELPDDDG